MAIDKNKYISKYVDEGLENITLIESLIFDIKDGISVEDDLSTLLRSLHTLKGTSRMLEFIHIEALCHCMESVFVAVREQRIGISDNAVKLILASLDLLKSGLAVIQQTNEDSIEEGEYVKNLALLASNDDFILPKTDDPLIPDKPPAMADKTLNENSVDQMTGENAANDDNSGRRNVSADDSGQIEKSRRDSKKDAKYDTIRLPLEKIDAIIRNIASLQSLEITARAISNESASLNNLGKNFYNLLKEGKISDPAALAANFRKVERLIGRINSTLKNFSADAGNSIRTAYDSVISLRTLPLSVIFKTYPRYVYQLSNELGKKVHLSIEGQENEIDKNIIEILSEVFMHMVRNALDHGLETPSQRAASGKNETGKLSIICSRESGSMKIVISDDGQGINFEKIRQKAVREGFVSEAAATSLTREDLTNFIFQSGFSTSGSVSNVSGRGVGLDVVRGTVEALKGSIVVESVYGEGTTFTIMVPLSIAALMGFPIVCASMKFIIPSTFVETILLINRDEIVTVVDMPEIKYGNRLIKLYYLSQVLEIKEETLSASDIIFAVIIRSYDDIAAFAVDNISSMRSVILKKMPSFLEKKNVFSGIVLNEDYEMVSVLHIPTIIKMAKHIKSIDIKKRNLEYEKSRKSILVVDDSRPTREVESDILTSEGYLVDTSCDGLQALKAAKSKHYDLICTDLNMPVMDGFMLIENIRKNDELSHIPVIVISSRENEEDQKRAAMLGASRFIIKNSFNNHNLLETVKELLGSAGE
ncbi:MAG: response regulator [Treponema sp.]|jgi:chemotaxis protein histidine kinase CheA|nr:response regulator [Treponema sp.]